GDLPARIVAVAGQRMQRTGFGQRGTRPVVEAGATAEIGDVTEGALRPRGDDGFAHGLRETGDLAEAEADRRLGAAMAAMGSFRPAGFAAVAAPTVFGGGDDQGVVPFAASDIHRQHLHARTRALAAARVLHDLA